MSGPTGGGEWNPSPKILVLGYGNPGRCDDGLGPAFAARVETLELAGVRTLSAFQLQLEFAADIAENDVVIFADASLGEDGPFALRPVHPGEYRPQFTTHTVSPEAVLGLAHHVLSAGTIGYTMGIRGHRFQEFGEELSPEAEVNLEKAVHFFRERMESLRLTAGDPILIG